MLLNIIWLHYEKIKNKYIESSSKAQYFNKLLIHVLV